MKAKEIFRDAFVFIVCLSSQLNVEKINDELDREINEQLNVIRIHNCEILMNRY